MDVSTDIKKSVVVLQGSPRKKGNSTILAKEISKGAETEGASIEELYIHGMNIKPCQACWGCQKKDSKGCVIDDDMQTVYPKLKEADVWVISSPVHWFNMSTQTKLWMDRCFAIASYGIDPSAKKIGIAMAYGDTDPVTSGCINAIRSFQDSFKYIGASIVGIVYGSAMNAGEISQNTDLLNQAWKLGKKLVS